MLVSFKDFNGEKRQYYVAYDEFEEIRKFCSGDIVWCKEKNKYHITDYRVKCVVVGYDEYDDLEVKIIDGEHKGIPFLVDEIFFEKCGTRFV